MKTGLSAAIRRFIEQNIVADDPYPQRSWLDTQDMPRLTVPVPEAASGLPVIRLSPLLGRRFWHRRTHPFKRLRGRHMMPVYHDDGAPEDLPVDKRLNGRWPS